MPRRHEKPDEGDRLREREIAYLRTLVRVLLAVLVLGALAAIFGGPGALQALAALQSALGVAP